MHRPDAIPAFLVFDRTSLSLSKTIIAERTTARSEIRDEYGVLRLSPFSIHRSDLWNTADGSVLLTRCSLSLSLFLFLPLYSSPSFSGSFSPSTVPVQPPPVYVRGSRRITASSRELVSRLVIIVMDRTFCPPHQPIR